MTSLLAVALRLGGSARQAWFQRATERPEAAQAATLTRLLARNRDTLVGRAHGFASITSPREYARRVPIRDFEGIRPWVDRVLASQPRVLTAETPTAFATSSGTTGQP